MIFKTKILCAAFLISSAFISASEPLRHQSWIGKALGRFSQTRMVCLFEKHVSPKLKRGLNEAMGYGDQPASEQSQALGKEAQKALNIPEERHVPIKCLNPEGLMAKTFKPGAVAEPDAIFVNEKRLKNRTHGARRSLFFHEAVHKKYNDLSTDTILEFLALLGTAFATHLAIRAFKPKGRFKFLHVMGVIIAGLSGSAITSRNYHHFMERRADIEGHYATACAECVQESAARRRHLIEKKNNLLLNSNMGYLPPQELEAIALDLKKDRQMCTYHKEHVSNNLNTEEKI